MEKSKVTVRKVKKTSKISKKVKRKVKTATKSGTVKKLRWIKKTVKVNGKRDRRLTGGGRGTPFGYGYVQPKTRTKWRSVKKAKKVTRSGTGKVLSKLMSTRLRDKKKVKKVKKPKTGLRKNAAVQMKYSETVERIMSYIKPPKQTFEQVVEKMIVHCMKLAVENSVELRKYKNFSKKLLVAVTKSLGSGKLPPHLMEQAAEALEEHLSKRYAAVMGY